MRIHPWLLGLLCFLFQSGFGRSLDYLCSRFAVVELFTSEGCSSCPPADRLMAELISENEKSAEPVYFLSFHVDYWNSLGWTDPFSRREYTERQEAYARSFSGRIYTPQMIVNGDKEFVGSNARAARQSIKKALSLKPVSENHPNVEGTVRVRNHSKSAAKRDSLTIDYSLASAEGLVLNLALVESGISVPVRRGENGGLTLKHENVVRSFKAIRLDSLGHGSYQMIIPSQVKPSMGRLIAYVQEPGSMLILGAWQSGI